MRCPECDSFLALDIEEEEYCPSCGWVPTPDDEEEEPEQTDDPMAKLPLLCCHCATLIDMVTGRKEDHVGMVLHFPDSEADFVAYELLLSQN